MTKISEIKIVKSVTRSTITTWYTVEGAPQVASESGALRLQPVSVSFTFIDGQFDTVRVVGAVVKKDGTLSDRTLMVPGIYPFSRNEWSEWLAEAYTSAVNNLSVEFRGQF